LCHLISPSRIGKLKSFVLGVFVHAHAAKLVGAIWLANALRESSGLSLLAFRLIAGNLLRHGPNSKGSHTGQIGEHNDRNDGRIVCPARRVVNLKYVQTNLTDKQAGGGEVLQRPRANPSARSWD
jgi:hypothetical protein